MKIEKRRDFLKKAGIFAGALAMLSVFNSKVINSALTLQSKTTNEKYFKISDNGNAVFFPEKNNKIEISSDGNLITTRRITSSYTYKGQGNSAFVPLPPGMFYPINQVWGYDYNFVKEVKINGNPISFNELTAIQQDGVNSVGSLAYGGFAWGVRNFSGLISNGDTVQATVEFKEIESSVKGIRVGKEFNPTLGSPKTYSYATRRDADDPTVPWDPAPSPDIKLPNDKVFWTYPNISEYAIAIFRLTKYRQTGYGVIGPDGSIKIGRYWKPYKTVEAQTYQTGISRMDVFSNQKRRCLRLAVFHKPTGAISNLSSEIILYGRHLRANVFGWEPTFKIKS